MTSQDWRQLALVSVTDPAAAARALIGMHLPREALWTGLILVAVLNTLIYTATNMLIPGPNPLPVALSAPALYFALVVGGLVLVIYAIFWTGRALGGEGGLEDIMVVMVWLQGLRVVVQALALVLLLVVPVLSGLLVLAAAILGLYILLHFIDQAHRLGSLGKAAGVAISAVLAMVLILSLILSLFGATITGVPNV
jgi:hypothetical protein